MRKKLVASFVSFIAVVLVTTSTCSGKPPVVPTPTSTLVSFTVVFSANGGSYNVSLNGQTYAASDTGRGNYAFHELSLTPGVYEMTGTFTSSSFAFSITPSRQMPTSGGVLWLQSLLGPIAFTDACNAYYWIGNFPSGVQSFRLRFMVDTIPNYTCPPLSHG